MSTTTTTTMLMMLLMTRGTRMIPLCLCFAALPPYIHGLHLTWVESPYLLSADTMICIVLAVSSACLCRRRRRRRHRRFCVGLTTMTFSSLSHTRRSARHLATTTPTSWTRRITRSSSWGAALATLRLRRQTANRHQFQRRRRVGDSDTIRSCHLLLPAVVSMCVPLTRAKLRLPN